MKVGPVNFTIEGVGPRGKFVLAVIAFDVVVAALLGIVLLADDSAPIAAIVEAPIAQEPSEGAGGGSAAWFALGGVLVGGFVAFFTRWFFDSRERKRRGIAALDGLMLEFAPFTAYIGMAIDAKTKGGGLFSPEFTPDASFPAFHRWGPEISAVVSRKAWATIRLTVFRAPQVCDLSFLNDAATVIELRNFQAGLKWLIQDAARVSGHELVEGDYDKIVARTDAVMRAREEGAKHENRGSDN